MLNLRDLSLIDAEDFGKGAPQPGPPDVLRIVHTGMFHSELAEIWDKIFAGEGMLKFVRPDALGFAPGTGSPDSKKVSRRPANPSVSRSRISSAQFW